MREGLIVIAGMIKLRELDVDLMGLTRREANRLRMRLEWEWRWGEPPPDGEVPVLDLRRQGRPGPRGRRGDDR